MDCPFCQIVQNESERVLKDGPLTITILSNPRLIPGHVLVVPKRHIEKPWEMTAEERKEVFDTLFLFQEKLCTLFSTGCDIRENYRPFLPEGWTKVNHIHFHLNPREPEDALFKESQIGERKLWQDLSEEERVRFWEMLKESN